MGIWATDSVRSLINIAINTSYLSPTAFLCKEEKSSSLHSSELLTETLCHKRQINKRKTTTNVLTRIPHIYMGDTQGKVSNSPRWLRIQA